MGSPTEYIGAGNGIVVEFEKENNQEANKVALGEDGFLQEGNSSDDSQNSKHKASTWNGKSRIGLASVDEVKVNNDGTLAFTRRLNGDQTHQGRHVHNSVGDYKTQLVNL